MSSVSSDLEFLSTYVQPKRTIRIHGIEDIFVLEQSASYGDMQRTVWPSSLTLAQFLADRLRVSAEPDTEDSSGSGESSARVRVPRARVPQRCLELGCGLGLVAKVLAALGHDVVASDKDLPDVACAGVSNVALDWSLLADLPAPPFDIIVAADVLYSKREHLILAQCLAALLRASPTAQCFLGYQVRDPAAEEMFLTQVLGMHGLHASPLAFGTYGSSYGRPSADERGDSNHGVEEVGDLHRKYTRIVEVSLIHPGMAAVADDDDPGLFL